MTWVAVAVGGATLVTGLYSANKASQSNKDALNAQQAAGQQSIAEQQREYDQSRADQLPFLQTGYGALDKEKAFLNGDWSGFQNSPDYKFALDQGIGALDKSAAARGALYSGGHNADLVNYAEGTANQFANNYWNKLAGQAGQGQVTAGNLGNLGANMANNVSNIYQNMGNARASSYLRQGQIAGQTAGLVGNTAGQMLGYYMNRPQTQSYTPSSFSDNYGSGDVANYYNNPGLNTGTYDVFGLGGGS